MQRLKGKKVLIGALAVLACSGDPTGNEGTPTAIRVQPEVVFVTQGDSQPVIVTVIDEDGQALEADFTTSNVGAGIEVVHDPTFLALDNPNQIRRQSRFFVKGVDLVATSFTLNALGLTKDVTVTSIPGSLSATISNPTPALGDTISITAPSGTFFTEASVLTFGGAEPVVVSQDASTIVFIPGPNIAGPAVVSDVGVTSNPNLLFTLATPDTVFTDSILDIGASLTPATPALGETVTLTLPAGLRLIPESLATINVEGAPVPPRDAALSADSSTITFVPSPNSDSIVAVAGVVPERLAACCGGLYSLRLTTTAKVTTPVVENFPSTVSDAAPDVNEAVTLSSTDANFILGAGASVMVGPTAAVVTARAGDGSSLDFVAPPGATGALTVSGVEVAGFPLDLPSTAPAVTVGTTVTEIAGTGATGTAPDLTVPDPGLGSVVYDNPASFDGTFFGFPTRFYRLVVPSETTLTITLEWASGEDIGGYLIEADGETLTDFDPADAHGEGADASPETATNTIPAGTYFLGLLNFSAANPTQIGITLTAE